MDVTVYLPDEIGKRAKDEGINLSRTLRTALEGELNRLEQMRKATDEPQVIEVRVVKNDDEFTGRITGSLIDRSGDSAVYLTDDERVVVYDEFRSSVEVLTVGEAREKLSPERFSEALRILGVTPVVDL